MQSLENKTVIITGGSRGIGRVLALRLAEEKANITIAARTTSEVKSTEEELFKITKNVLALNADVSKYEDVIRIVNGTVQKFKKIDYLVNNAAIMTHKTVKDFGMDEWKQVIDVNLFGAFMMCKEVLPHMEKLSKSTGGTIVNICSTSARRGYERGSAYVASKFALNGFSQCLFQECRQSNIRVVSVFPSYVETSVKDESKLKEIGKGVYMRAEDVADAVVNAMKIPQRTSLREIELWCTNP
jgi:3-oxoacyl-[acyl-carrier protein] reductase